MTRENCGVRRTLGVAALLTTTALAGAAVFAPAAWAQATATTSQTVSGAPVGSAEARATLSEVVVTAQKRSERLLDTPLSVTAISAQSLEALGATQFRDVANTIPGLSFTTNGVGQSQINLRGITTGANVSPTVGVYVDDVPYGSSTPFAASAQLALDVGLFDIDHLEILRGPQGTLYGASTEGGLLKYVTVTPDTRAFSGLARAGVSGTEDGGVNYDAALAVNAPLVEDKAAVRISGFYSHDAGDIDNLTLGRNNVNRSGVYGGRIDLLLKPIDKLTIRLAAFTQNINRDGAATADYNDQTSKPIEGSLDQRRLLAEPFHDRFRLVSGSLTYDFGPAQLTSISSYQTAQSSYDEDYSTLYVPLLVPALAPAGIDLNSIELAKTARTDKFTQEIRLGGDSEWVRWLVGAFYTDEKSVLGEGLPGFSPTGAAVPLNLLTLTEPSTFDEVAGFGTVTVHATRKLDITGGVRYAYDDQSAVQNGSGLLIGSLPEQKSTDSVATYLADISYRPTTNTMAYFRFATGYRPGGPNVVANGTNGQPLAPPTFQPDKLNSYEGGVKASTADHRFSIDADVYLIDWNDIQIAAIRNGVGILANAPSAQSKGAEVTLTAQPIHRLNLVGAFGYTDAALSADAPDLGGSKGDRLPDTPRFTATVSADYSFNLAGYDLFAGGTLRHVSDRVASFNESASTPQYRLPEYTTTDLRTGAYVQGARVELFVRNLFDSRGQISANTTFVPAAGPAEVSILQPRTVGLDVSRRF